MNRFIEFVSHQEVVNVSKDFIVLVESGLDPEYAFEVVTHERRTLNDRFMHRQLQHPPATGEAT